MAISSCVMMRGRACSTAQRSTKFWTGRATKPVNAARDSDTRPWHRPYSSQQSLDMLLQRIQIKRLGQDRRVARDRAVAVEDFLRITADKDHFQFRSQLDRRFSDLYPGNSARQAVVRDHQVQVRLGREDFEGLLPINRLQYSIPQPGQVS